MQHSRAPGQQCNFCVLFWPSGHRTFSIKIPNRKFLNIVAIRMVTNVAKLSIPQNWPNIAIIADCKFFLVLYFLFRGSVNFIENNPIGNFLYKYHEKQIHKIQTPAIIFSFVVLFTTHIINTWFTPDKVLFGSVDLSLSLIFCGCIICSFIVFFDLLIFCTLPFGSGHG